MSKKIFNRLRSFYRELLYPFSKKVTANVSVMGKSELLKERNALITGGTSGIGYAIAESFVQSGAKVTITGRDSARVSACCARLISEHDAKGKVFGIVLNNLEVESFESKFNEVIQMMGRVDILVNNAGVIGGKLPNASETDFDKVIDTNLKAPFFLSQLVSNYMIKNNIKGNILNIASSSSLRPAISAYTLSKWGLRGMTLGLAKSLIPYGIVVNGIAPGPTATPMLNRMSSTDIALNTNPTGRYALPEEIANMAVLLVSNMGQMIVGDIVYMTGGAGLITFEDMDYNIY